jgi:protein-S-isoprenylcysteine O-methyltransferase Ste14
MQKYISAGAFALIIATVLIRVLSMRKSGISAFKFGKIDKNDFFIPPFVFVYFYFVIANLFNLPLFGVKSLFQGDALSLAGGLAWVDARVLVDVLAWAGALFSLFGLALMLLSLISFRSSFRVGIDEENSGGLITSGVFAFSRNPIYVAFFFVMLGEFCVFPNFVFIIYLVAACWLFNRQVLREEEFLKKHYGDEYREYCSKVRRYL